jgi:DNA polymerase-1
MLDPMKELVIGPDQVKDKFGVTPDKVIDVQALAGDSTDNVPGVPGIGVKTAAELINTYGDLETLLSRAAGVPSGCRRQARRPDREHWSAPKSESPGDRGPAGRRRESGASGRR